MLFLLENFKLIFICSPMIFDYVKYKIFCDTKISQNTSGSPSSKQKERMKERKKERKKKRKKERKKKNSNNVL